MGQPRQRANFAQKTLPVCGRQVGVYRLDRHLAAQLAVMGAVHAGAAAFTERLAHLVAPGQQRARHARLGVHLGPSLAAFHRFRCASCERAAPLREGCPFGAELNAPNLIMPDCKEINPGWF